MKKIIIILLAVILFGCNSNNQIEGVYNAVSKNTIIESVSFDGTVASFGGRIGKLMPASKYEVKDNKIYVESHEGILVFNIMDSNTIQCETSIFKNEIFKK
ncbi:hypothetical protein [Winogradskyella sp. 4-2091]|uniref:hypothetical protein n=1 Tax=Winogradskyella sp. 4-2091 TaxID=3381659 RepID=UPI00389280A8